MIERKVIDNTHVIIGDSVSDIMNLTESPKNSRFDYAEHLPDWFGCSNGKQGVNNLIHRGWEEGYNKAKKIQEQINSQLSPPTIIKKRKVFKDFGESIDIQKVYNGQLDSAWTSSHKEEVLTQNKIITLKTSIGGLGSKSPEQLFFKGVSAIILTDILEDSGYRVELKAYSHARNSYKNNMNSYTEFTLKKENEILDFQKIITVTALAGFFRYHIFKARCSEEDRVNSRIGYTIESALIYEDNEIIINNVYDLNGSINTINSILEKFRA